MEDSMEIPLETRNKTTIQLSNTTSRNIPEETKTEKDTCTPTLTAALFTIAVTWKQARGPSTDEWIKKVWYIYRVEHYSAIKRNAFESVLRIWMNLEPITQSEVDQKEKNKYRMSVHIHGIRKMVLMNLLAGQQQRHRHREQTCGHGWSGGKERVRQMERVAWKHIHHHT